MTRRTRSPGGRAGGGAPVAFRPVPIFLVRHAHAGKRSQWEGDDRLRPLSDRGWDQARWLASTLAAEPIGRILSSPFLRCTQTVDPLAAQLGAAVETCERLAEDADPDDALDVLLGLAPHHGVACSHGDLIPELLHRLTASGMAVEGPLDHRKGSVWVLDVDREGDGVRVTRGRYLPPPR